MIKYRNRNRTQTESGRGTHVHCVSILCGKVRYFDTGFAHLSFSRILTSSARIECGQTIFIYFLNRILILIFCQFWRMKYFSGNFFFSLPFGIWIKLIYCEILLYFSLSKHYKHSPLKNNLCLPRFQVYICLKYRNRNRTKQKADTVTTTPLGFNFMWENGKRWHTFCTFFFFGNIDQ